MTPPNSTMMRVLRGLLADLMWQKQDIQERGELVEDYRICAICVNYVLRATYDAHLTQVHGYEHLSVSPRDRITEGEEKKYDDE